jgi:single-strand DNA-binding protein
MSVNNVTLLGRLGKDVNLKQTLTGKPVCDFSIATSEKWTKDGQTQERTEWHNIEVYGRLAELCDQYISKGSMVYIEGKLRTNSWGEGDSKRYSTVIVANTVQFLDSKKTESNTQENINTEKTNNNNKGYAF